MDDQTIWAVAVTGAVTGVVGSITGVLGSVVGTWAFWRQVDDDRVKLKVATSIGLAVDGSSALHARAKEGSSSGPTT